MHEIHIDYLQFSLPTNNEYKPIKYIFATPSDSVTPSFMRNYTVMMQDEITGATAHIGHNKSDKTLYVMTGNALEITRAIYGDAWGDIALLKSIMRDGATISRLDVALTQYVTDDLITVKDVTRYQRHGAIETRYKDAPSLIGTLSDNGVQYETLYYGNMRKRARYGVMRVYDKGLAWGLDRDIVTRFEIETRRDKANVTARRLASGTMTLSQAISTQWMIKSKRFCKMINGEPVKLSRSTLKRKDEDKRASRWLWLHDTVAPSLAQAMIDDIDNGYGHENYIKFTELVKKRYNEIMRRKYGD